MAADIEQGTRQLYEFGPFRVDTEKELLLRGHESVPLTPKTFQILLVLVRRKKELVTKDELMKAVWPDTFVEEANLSRNIFLLRKALGETPQDHQYILTVPGRGYRFAEDVRLVPEHDVKIVSASHTKIRMEVKESSRWPWVVVTVVLVLVGTAAGLRFFGHREPKLGQKDTVVLADFVNSTGDPVFDGTLRQGLAVQLEQSPFLKIMDDADVQRSLRLMNVASGTHVTNAMAHDICVREGASATIDGAIASLGKIYVITLQSTTCQKGETLAREQVEAPDKEHVLSALDKAATGLRGKLGESLTTIQQVNLPLEQASTPSLEALQAYSDGMAVMSRGQFRAAIPLFERAIATDAKFAMAYYMLAIAWEQAGDVQKCAENAARAFSLVERVSSAERTELTAYHYRITGELDKEIDAYQQALRENHPRPWSFHNQLAVIYNDMGRFEEGLHEGQEALRLRPDVEPPYRRVLDAYMCLELLKEADETVKQVRAHGIDGMRIHQRFLELAYLENDKEGLNREIEWFRGRPDEYLSSGLQAAMLNVQGQLREAHALYKRAADQARKEGFPYIADGFEEADARAAALAGDCRPARKLGRPALALALCGDGARAQKLAAEFSKQESNNTIWNAVQLPEISAITAMERGDPATAVEMMMSATPYERAYPDAIYIRGLALLKLHKVTEAAKEFQKVVDHKGASWGATWDLPNWGQYYVLSYLGMARAYASVGDRAKARDAYDDFFALWINSDRNIPVLAKAREEYARLN
ncbi:winged helix-turn-helix domain-containing protein [Occallatibacter savannae]|uniref:winged helix-turn-helix domain-containing protein n=1 Tax=Occallatibacter savannae TaxID=1002691 RepID=UPI000D699BFC|nr:winged helix-turn-helix domain-containing protein [Occallatibacter savannae]